MPFLPRILMVCLGVVLSFFVLSEHSFAASKEKGVTLDKRNAIYDPTIGAYVTPLKKVNNKLVPVSKEEYLSAISKTTIDNTPSTNVTKPQRTSPLSILSNSTSANDIRPLRDYYEYWVYDETDWYETYGSTKKVTSTIYCNTPGGCSISKQVGVTVSATFSTSVSAERDAIAAGASFSWTWQASDSSTYTFNLKYGDSGYIGFRPLYKKTYGYLKKYSNWDGYLGYKKYAEGYSPKKTANGEADGYYYFVYQ
jgi:hypothetical protein